MIMEHPFLQFTKDEGVNIPFDNLVNYQLDTKIADRLFDSDGIKGMIQYKIINNTLYATLSGTMSSNANGTLEYMAAAPITRGYSYSGSGLPFPNPKIAYSGTNVETVKVDGDGDFSFTFEFPNSYYVRQGTVLLNPHVHLYSPNSGKVYTIEVGNRIPNKSLTGLSDRFDRSTRR